MATKKAHKCVVVGCKNKAIDRGGKWYSCDSHYGGRGVHDLIIAVVTRLKKGQIWSITLSQCSY